MTSKRQQQRIRATVLRANKLRERVQKANRILKPWPALHGPRLILLTVDSKKEDLAAWLIIALRCRSQTEAMKILKAITDFSIYQSWEKVAEAINLFKYSRLSFVLESKKL